RHLLAPSALLTLPASRASVTGHCYCFADSPVPSPHCPRGSRHLLAPSVLLTLPAPGRSSIRHSYLFAADFPAPWLDGSPIRSLLPGSVVATPILIQPPHVILGLDV